MISKFAVLGRDRAEAIDRMRRALAEYEVGGIKTTLPFFRDVMNDQEFIDGRLDTGFISRFNMRRRETESSEAVTDAAIIAAALVYSKRGAVPPANSIESGSTRSRWAAAARLAGINHRP